MKSFSIKQELRQAKNTILYWMPFVVCGIILSLALSFVFFYLPPPPLRSSDLDNSLRLYSVEEVRIRFTAMGALILSLLMPALIEALFRHRKKRRN